MAGLITLRRERWQLTEAYRRMFERQCGAGVYAQLLHAFVTKYAWNWGDPYPALDIVQTCWAFSLLFLLRHRAARRDSDLYADPFTRAFPMTVDEAAHVLADHPWKRNPRSAVNNAYEVRVLEHLAAYLGLVEVEPGAYGRLVRVLVTLALAEVAAVR
jgi:hypothetical protein